MSWLMSRCLLGRLALAWMAMCVTGVDSATSATTDDLPLQPTRTVRFTTDEGTWISLDVSPDGKTIVFELLGDLYTLPITGGQARRITSGMAFDAQPRYSPDGSTVVFVSDRNGPDNLWLVDADGSNPRALTDEPDDRFMSPEWTPDGMSVVVTRSVGGSSSYAWARAANDLALYVYHRGGGAGIKLTTQAPAAPVDQPYAGPVGYTGAAFGGESQTLFAAFSSSSTSAQVFGQPGGIWQIVSIDRRTAQPLVLTDEPGGAARPIVSPNNRYLVYATTRDDITSLRIRDLRTEQTKTLVEDVTHDVQRKMDIGRDLMPGAAFTPDSRALIVSFGGKLWRISVPDGQVTAIPFIATVEQQLGPLLLFDQAIDDDRVDVRQIRDARPSPDGRQLVFSALDRLWIMSLPKGEPRRLTNADIGEFFPVWSPDGRYIAYATWSEHEGGAIHRIRSTGRATPQVLTRNPKSYYYEKLAYAPDGKTLLASRSSAQYRARWTELEIDQSLRMLNATLIRLPAAGGQEQEIMPLTAGNLFTPTFYGVPHFSRDDGRIYLNEYDGGLVGIDADSKVQRAVLKVSGWWGEGASRSPTPAEEILISPDGTQALALASQDLYLIDLPSVTPPEPPALFVGKPAPLPMRRLTRTQASGPAADFPGWMADGRLYYSLGRSFFIYDPKSHQTERVDVDLSVPRDKPVGALLLRGARLISMRGTEVIENGDLLIVNNRIAAIGARGQIPVPADAHLIDVSGKTIMPGLIDVHGHLWPAWGAHNAQPWEFAATLAYGVTANRDPQTLYLDVLTYGDRLDAGDMLGPRMFSTGRGIFSPDVMLKDLDDARAVLRRYSEFYRTHTIKQYLVGDRQRRQWIAMAAAEQGLTPTLEGGSDFKMNLTTILDGYSGIEHWVGYFPLYRDVTELMARSGTTISSHDGGRLDYFFRRYPVHDDAKLRRFMPHASIDKQLFRARSSGNDAPFVFPANSADAARIIAAGGRVALGSHADFPAVGVHWELWAMQSGGMLEHEALRMATLAGANAIGLGKQLGSLEPGKLADLLILDADPLQDIHHSIRIRHIMKNGRLYDGDTLDELWPRRRPFKPR